MRAVLESRIKTITDDIKVTTAKAIASLVKDDEINEEHILPNIFDKTVVETIVSSIKETIKKG
jgi:malate dehydrogenase (oxaloacetate-decarboxylating)